MLTLALQGTASCDAQSKEAVDDAAWDKALAAMIKHEEELRKHAAERALKAAAKASDKGGVGLTRKRSRLLTTGIETQAVLSPQTLASAIRSECQPMLAEDCATALPPAPPAQNDVGALLGALVARQQSGPVLGSVLTATGQIISELERLASGAEKGVQPSSGALETLAAFMETQLSNVSVQMTCMEGQLGELLATQQEILSGQRALYQR